MDSTMMLICGALVNSKCFKCVQRTLATHMSRAHDFTEELPIRVDHSLRRHHHLWLGFRSEVRTFLQDWRRHRGKRRDLINSSTVTYGLANGGTGGLLLIFLINFFGLLAVVMCLAEMSSM